MPPTKRSLVTTLLAILTITAMPVTSLMAGVMMAVPVPSVAVDEIRLVDGNVLEGTVLNRGVNGLVLVQRPAGETEYLPARAIDAIRRASDADWITLREALGEPDLASESKPGREGGSSSTLDTDGAVELEEAKKNDAESAAGAVVLFHLDRGVSDWHREGRRVYEMAWRRVAHEIARPRSTLLVCVDDPYLSASAVDWLRDQIRPVSYKMEVGLVVRRAGIMVLPLLAEADRCHWVRGGVLQSSSVDREVLERLKRDAPRALSDSMVEALGSGRGLSVDDDAVVVEFDAKSGSVGIDDRTAGRLGMCGGTFSGLDRLAVRNRLDLGPTGRVKEVRLSKFFEQRSSDLRSLASQVAAGQAVADAVRGLVLETRDLALEFDALYRGNNIGAIWRRDLAWPSKTLESRSTRLQTKVRSAIGRLRAECARLRFIYERLPLDVPERARFLRLWEQVEPMLDLLLEYEGSLIRNNPNQYRDTRDAVVNLRLLNG